MSNMRTICFAASVAVALLAADIASSHAQSGSRSLPSFSAGPSFSGGSGTRAFVAPTQRFAAPTQTFRAPSSFQPAPVFSSAPATFSSAPVISSPVQNFGGSGTVVSGPVFSQQGIITSGFHSGGCSGF